MSLRSSAVAIDGCAALLAHQGGWDEIALIAGPIVVIAGLLVLAKRRVDAAAQGESASKRSTSDRGD